MPKEHNSKTTPVAVGVEMTSGFLEKAPLLRNNIIHLGERTDTGPVTLHQLAQRLHDMTTPTGIPCRAPCAQRCPTATAPSLITPPHSTSTSSFPV